MKKIVSILLFSLGIFQTLDAQTTLYARANGLWNATTTWSSTGPLGLSCSCTPASIDSVVINGFDVTLNVNGDVKSLNIFNSSSLTFNNSIGLDINAGAINIQNGGILTHTGTGSAAHIDFELGTSSLVVASTGIFETDDINIAGSAVITFSGDGDVTLTDDILYNGANSSLINNLSGNLNLTGVGLSSLWFTSSSSGCSFTNNGTVNCDRYLFVQGANTTVTNTGTINLTNASYGILFTSGDATGTIINNSATGTININGLFNVSNNQMTFNNSGLLDLEGDLSAWSSTAPSEFHNLSGSTFKFAGTGNFYGNFYANYDANIVLYDNATTLQNELILPQDNYWMLTFDGFQKQIKSNFTCKGDFIINTNTFITTTRTITMENDADLTISNGGSLTRSSGSGAVIFLNNTNSSLIINDAATGFSWDNIGIGYGCNVTISGTGTLTLDDDFSFSDNNSNVTNNLTGDFTCDNIFFFAGSANNTFTNNDTIAIAGILAFRGIANTFNNNGVLSTGGDLLFLETSCKVNNASGATLTIGDDLWFNGSSGSKLNNAGTVDINGVGSFKGILFGNTTDTVENSGTLTTLGKLRIMSNANDDNVIINSVGGTFNVASDFQLNDADFIFDNSGTFNLTGRFDDFAGTESIYNRAGATINYEGVHNINLNGEISLFSHFTGSTFNYSRADGTTQDVITPQSGYGNISLSGSGIKETQASLVINGDVTISGTAVFDVNTNNDDLTVKGNWSSTAVFDAGISSVTLNGTADQTIDDTGSGLFYNLIVNKATGNVILGSDLDINNTLTLTAGAFDLNNNQLSINMQSTTAIIRTAGYIISDQTDNSSKLLRNIGNVTGSFLFPFGKSTGDYIPFTLELTAGDIGEVTVATYFTGADNLPFPTAPDAVTNVNRDPGIDNSAYTIDRFWQIDKTGVSGTTNITFTYAQSEVSSNASPLESELNAQRYNTASNMWEAAINGQVTNIVSNTVTVPNVSTFSPWTLATSSSPLPITLIDFNVQLVNDYVSLRWNTVSEINNDFFTLERSYDLKEFVPFYITPGMGNSSIIINYAYDDLPPQEGVIYYRLKQTDYNGEFSYSKMVAVEYHQLANNNITLYPNPVLDQLTIDTDIEIQKISIMNNTRQNVKGFISTSNKVNVEDLSDGIYFIKIIGPTQQVVKKFVKK